jgi:lipopolysaccharide/colanic/teichoic acid biosynthesis glycosyltransferase
MYNNSVRSFGFAQSHQITFPIFLMQEKSGKNSPYRLAAHMLSQAQIQQLENNHLRTPRYYLSRVIEIILVLAILPIALFLSSAIALWIYLDDGRPVLFIQERPGYKGKLFKMIKFRTLSLSDAKGSIPVGVHDKRLSRSGKILRKYRLDEIPQLLNILKGDMALVGPRPLPIGLCEWNEEHIPHFALRYSVRPGLTGLAQIMMNPVYTPDEHQIRVEHDLFYAVHSSIKMDLWIVLNTFRRFIV